MNAHLRTCCFGLLWKLACVALLLGLVGCGGQQSACPSCLAILLKIPKPTNVATKSPEEIIYLRLTVKDADGWIILKSSNKIRKEGALYIFDSQINQNQGIQVVAPEAKEVTTPQGDAYELKTILMAFSLSDAGKDSLRSSGMNLRLLSLAGDEKLLFMKDGQVQEQNRSQFKFEVKGNWQVNGLCQDSFTLGEVLFQTQAQAQAQTVAWGGQPCN